MSCMSSILVEHSVSGLHESLLLKISGLIDHSDPILDLGCGSGAWLARLTRHGFTDLAGIDQDISQTPGDAACFVQGDLDSAAAWLVLNDRYKLITAIEVIEHLSNIGNFLFQALNRVH